MRRLDPVWGDNDTARQANADTFFYTNAAPQHKDLNQKIWNELEDYILDNADAQELKISVMTGPVFDAGDPVHRGVQIPRSFWKIVAFVDSEGELLASGYLLDQSHLITEIPEEFTFGAFKTFQVSIDLISRMTRLDLDVLIRADVLGTFESPQRMPLADLESIVLSPAEPFQLAECHGTRTRNMISLERFQELARDLDVPDSVLGDYLTEDHSRSSAFQPAVRIDPLHVSLPDEELPATSDRRFSQLACFRPRIRSCHPQERALAG